MVFLNQSDWFALEQNPKSSSHQFGCISSAFTAVDRTQPRRRIMISNESSLLPHFAIRYSLSMGFSFALPLASSHCFSRSLSAHTNSRLRGPLCEGRPKRRRRCCEHRVSHIWRAGHESSTERDEHAPEQHGFLHVATVTTSHGLNGDVKATIMTDFPSHRLSPSVNIPRFLLLPGRNYPRPCTLLSARPASKPHSWILKFEHVRSLQLVREHRLIGARIYVRAGDRPPLARGEFVAASLIGLRVSLQKHSDESQIDDDDDTLLSKSNYYVAHTKRGEVLADQPIGVIDEVMTAQQICKASGGGSSAAAVANDVLSIALFEHPDLLEKCPFTKAVPESASRVLVPFVRQIVPVVDTDAALVVIDPPSGLLSATIVNHIEKPRAPRALLPPALI